MVIGHLGQYFDRCVLVDKKSGYVPLDKQSHSCYSVNMVAIIKDTEFTGVARGVKPDSKKRVVLPGVLVKEGVTYHIYRNRFGQIVLDPQVTIPASELWLFENKEALASIDKAMTEEQVIKRGSFAKYVKDAA